MVLGFTSGLGTNTVGESVYPQLGQTIVPAGTGIGRGFNTLLTDTTTAGQGTSLREMRVRDFGDVEKYMEPTETPFTSSLSQGAEVRSKRPEWATGHLTPNTALIGTTGFPASGNTGAVDIDVPGRIHPGSMILVENEQIWVQPDAITATGIATGKYTRGIGGTTIAAHTTGAKVQVMLGAALENQDTPFRGITRARLEWNTAQLSDVGIWGSDRDLNTPDIEFGDGDKYDAYLERVIKETTILWEINAILGNRSGGWSTYGGTYPNYPTDYLSDPEGNTATPTSVGGLKFFTPLAYNLAGAPLTEFILQMMAMDTVMRVGEGNSPTKLFVGGMMRVILNSLFSAQRYATVKDDVTNLVWRRMMTSFGDIDFVFSRYIPDGEAYFVNTKDITKHFFRGGSWKEVLLPSLGPYKRGRYTGDVTLKFKRTNARSRIYGISTNVADYPNLT
jgi:hypothetical protein